LGTCAAKFPRDDVTAGPQVLLQLGFHKQPAVFSQLTGHSQSGRSDHDQADGNADQQFDQ
jgi:hypothetical protein